MRRWSRRLAFVVVGVLAVTGGVSVYRLFTAPPGVGHFRSVEGREVYAERYRETMRQLPQPTATHDVPTSLGVVRAYEWSAPQTAGQTPVVLVPGRASGVPMWAANLPGFAQSRRVIAFDALGDAGMSVQAVPLRSTDDQAIWIDEVLAELAPDGAHLVGHSFGGATAAAYARQHPQRVRSLTLLEPVFTFGYPPASVFWWATLISLPGIPQGIREDALGRIGGVDDYDGSDPMAQMIDAGSQHYSAQLPTPSPLEPQQASRLTMPVYVAIAGTDSLAGAEKAAERAREILPDGQVQVWPQATHSLPMQVADPLDDVLREFWTTSEG